MEITSKKRLEMALSNLESYEFGEVRVEQYSTPSSIAADILWDCYMKGGLEGKVIVDLGCGSGILGIGCLMLGAKKVHFVDSESSALDLLAKNLEKMKEVLSECTGSFDVTKSDVTGFETNVDTCIMNPPFGTKLKHIDRRFLEQAFKFANLTYSFHKTSTIDYISTWSKKQGMKVVERFDFKYLLKKTMKHHRKDKQYIQVSCLIFKK